MTVKNGRVYLEREDGQVDTVELEKLSVEDLKHLATLPEYQAAVTPLLPSEKEGAVKSAARVVSKIRVDDESTSGEVRRWESSSWGVTSIAFSPDGGMLAIGRLDRALALLDVDTMQTLSVHDQLNQLSSVSCVAFSPDGSKLLAGGGTGVVQVCSVDSTRRLLLDKDFKIHDSQVYTIAVSGDNRFVLSGGSRDFRYWKMASGEDVSGWEGSSHGVKGTFISGQGGQGLLADTQTVALVDLRERKLLQTMRLGQTSGQSLAIAPNGSHIAANQSRAMHVWETATGKQLPLMDAGELQWGAAFSPDGRYLLSSGNARISVWSLESQKRVYQFSTSDSGYVKSLAFSPDGIHFAATCGPISKVVQIFRLPPELR